MSQDSYKDQNRISVTRRGFLMSPIFALLIFTAGCGGDEKKDQWGVLLMGLPDKVSTANADLTTTYYILKQTHEPLFRRDAGENYRSVILTGWGRDITGKQYSFCPDATKTFSDTEPFDQKYFDHYIKKVTAKYTRDFAVVQKSGCFEVHFPVPQKSYLEFLSLYENAPSVLQSDASEMGLGPFRVVEMGKDRIVLERKKHVRNGYNQIVLIEYSPVKASSYDYSKIVDFNKLAASDIPPGILDNYFGFSNIELRSDVLIINHPDIEIRKRIYNCLDVDRFRRSFFPKKDAFLDISNVLPMGIFGAAPGLPAQDCGYPKGRLREEELVLFNHRSGNTEQLEDLAKDFRSRTGLKMKVISRSPQELGKYLHKSPRPYNMVVIALGTITPDYRAILESIVKPDGYYDHQSSELKEIYAKLVQEPDPSRKNLLVLRFLKKLREEFLVLPLYQNVKELYYPKMIKNITVGREFSEYPEIADFRW